MYNQENKTEIFVNGVADNSDIEFDGIVEKNNSFILIVDELKRALKLKNNTHNFPNPSYTFNFFVYLASNPIGNILTYEEIYKYIWQPKQDFSQEYMEERIQNLIQTVVENLFGGKQQRENYIKSVPGKGIQTTQDIKMILRKLVSQ